MKALHLTVAVWLALLGLWPLIAAPHDELAAGVLIVDAAAHFIGLWLLARLVVNR